VVHRYYYDGSTPAARETYRYRKQAGDKLILDTSRAEVTRFVPLTGDPSGPMAYADNDGQVDVRVTDRYGRDWFWYRAAEGKTHVPGEEKTFPGEEMRGTGILKPLDLPRHEYLEYSPWYVWMLEPDLLAGRWGLARWNGKNSDLGLLLPELKPIPVSAVQGSKDLNLLLFIGGTLWGIIKVGAAIAVVAAANFVGGPVLAAAIGASLLTTMFTSSLIERLPEGQRGGTLARGIVGDVTGFGGAYAGCTNFDFATGKYLGLSSWERGEAFGGGMAQLGLLVYGGYRAGRGLYVRGRAAWQAYRDLKTPVEFGPDAQGAFVDAGQRLQPAVKATGFELWKHGYRVKMDAYKMGYGVTRSIRDVRYVDTIGVNPHTGETVSAGLHWKGQILIDKLAFDSKWQTTHGFSSHRPVLAHEIGHSMGKPSGTGLAPTGKYVDEFWASYQGHTLKSLTRADRVELLAHAYRLYRPGGL